MKLLRNLADRLSRRTTRGENLSVRDFKNTSHLKKALQKDKRKVLGDDEDTASVPGSIHVKDDSSSREDTWDTKSCVSMDSAEAVEWKIPLVDVQTTEPQTMDDEVKRLKVLQSYFILDSEGDEQFDCITRLASKLFDAPYAVVSLVDLGRQWFLSKVGMDATEAPRKYAFCAHTILNKYKILIVPDATQDFRFKDNPFVSGPPHVRFYAGAALVSPEGCKLGTLCVFGSTPRPQGVTIAEQEMLQEMAAMVVNTMVSRRDRLIKAQYETKLQELGSTLLVASQALKDCKQVVSAVVSRSTSKHGSISDRDTKELAGAAYDLEVQASMCTAVARSLIEKEDNADPTTDIAPSEGEDAEQEFDMDSFARKLEDILDPSTDMKGLFDGLNTVLGNFRHECKITTEFEANVPKLIAGEDLLIFRSALNLVLHGISRSPCGSVHLRVSMKDGVYVTFECDDSGPIIAKAEVKSVFHHEESLLAPVASMIRTMNGYYGMKIKAMEDEDTVGSRAAFWFRVPAACSDSTTSPTTDSEDVLLRETLRHVIEPNVAPSKTSTASSSGEQVHSDPFRMALMESGGCSNQGQRFI